MGRAAGRVVAGDPAASSLAGPAPSTNFSAFKASFTIGGGIAHNADLLAQGTLFSMAGAGDIDLAREHIDYTLACTLTGASAALPVHLQGPWDAIGWQVGGKEISSAAVKKKARDKLNQAIRGLLQR